ncbi:hypothetical protein D7Z26_22225 [Cohnella endophytica]|uniref:Uncharacterized protein n=1 Tax=Cohnella endophytica TaxID=2419778 RepID=A0A494XIC2_9BACL|nr:hypothetical protein [Cohnella endophytica]RKP47929.1 hypothetical protein D7Z26_22225 [Cohnella endophytica]
MRLFRMKANLEGANRLPEFLEGNYVCYGRPGIGDLDKISKADLREQLAKAYRLDGQELDRRLEEYCDFASGMQDGDYLIVDDGERLHLGDVGDYYYLDHFDNLEECSGHRRGVTWLRSLRREDLHPELLNFLGREGEIGMFGRPVTQEELENLLTKPAASGSRLIDEETIMEALGILKEVMRSDDAERRERAAIAILQAARF